MKARWESGIEIWHPSWFNKNVNSLWERLGLICNWHLSSNWVALPKKIMKTDNIRNWNLFSTQLIKHFSCGIAAGIGSAPKLQWHDFARTKQIATPKRQIYRCQKISIKHTKKQFIDLPFGLRDRHRAVKSKRRPTLPYPPIMKCNTSETGHKTGFWFMLDWNLIWKTSKFNQA